MRLEITETIRVIEDSIGESGKVSLDLDIKPNSEINMLWRVSRKGVSATFSVIANKTTDQEIFNELTKLVGVINGTQNTISR
jgi:predicted regulator of amino acid metabolism with ACT domain